MSNILYQTEQFLQKTPSSFCLTFCFDKGRIELTGKSSEEHSSVTVPKRAPQASGGIYIFIYSHFVKLIFQKF
jgi:hypothetical protein